MNPKLFVIFPILFHFLSLNIYCQELNQNELIKIAEDLATDETDPEAGVIFMEQLNELSENPVKINSADINEISRLFFLSDFQIRSIIDHVKSTGKIVSVYEIASIPGFDRRTAGMMIPLITLEESPDPSNDHIPFSGRLTTNLIIKPGESDSSYLGSPLKILSKYKVNSGSLSAGFTCEKDPGERMFTGSPSHPDFFSAYISFNGQGYLRKLIAGDFSAKFGQGTSVNSGIYTGLTLTAPTYSPPRNEIKPYTSTDENNFFRGIATEFAIGKLSLITLFSHNRIDATTRISEDSATFYINSFYTTGLHNTASLTMKNDVAAETFYGMNFSLNLSHLILGVNWSETKFSVPVKPSIDNPWDFYDFEGKTCGTFSAYYTGIAGKMMLCGEASVDYSYNYAIIQSFTLRPSDRLALSCLYRNYSPGFTGLQGKGPGNNSSTGNEEGILGNFTFEAARYLFISAGYDICRYPWLKYRTSFPSIAKKYEIKLKYLPGENLNIDVSYNQKYSMSDSKKNRGAAMVQEIIAGTLRTNFRYYLNENFSLNTRIDYKSVRQTGSKGMFMAQDIIYKLRNFPLQFWARYCIFRTDDWSSRLYIYENDLLYSFSIPAYSGSGIRSYIMVKWNIGNFAELRVKYGLTSYMRPSDITDDQIEDEFKLQFRILF